MTHSVTEIICNQCQHKYTGYLDGIFYVKVEYATQCPQCETLNTFCNRAGLIDVSVPHNAVKINYIKRL